MQVRISDDALLPDLLDYLRMQVDVVVAQVGPDQLEANILGYGLDSASLELDLRLRAWEVAHPEVTVEQVSSPLPFPGAPRDAA
jgi:hypothetical protein